MLTQHYHDKRRFKNYVPIIKTKLESVYKKNSIFFNCKINVTLIDLTDANKQKLGAQFITNCNSSSVGGMPKGTCLQISLPGFKFNITKDGLFILNAKLQYPNIEAIRCMARTIKLVGMQKVAIYAQAFAETSTIDDTYNSICKSFGTNWDRTSVISDLYNSLTKDEGMTVANTKELKELNELLGRLHQSHEDENSWKEFDRKKALENKYVGDNSSFHPSKVCK